MPDLIKAKPETVATVAGFMQTEIDHQSSTSGKGKSVAAQNFLFDCFACELPVQGSPLEDGQGDRPFLCHGFVRRGADRLHGQFAQRHRI
jgi:hypothetical protein